jgi:hypothetical protein
MASLSIDGAWVVGTSGTTAPVVSPWGRRVAGDGDLDREPPMVRVGAS